MVHVVAKPFLKYFVQCVPRSEGQGFDGAHALLPPIDQLSKIPPLYKECPLLDPSSYRILVVSGTMYRLYVCHSLLTHYLMHISRHTVWFLPGPEHSATHVHP